LEYTGCDGVMSSEAILEYPALFNGPSDNLVDIDQIALEYLHLVKKYPGEADFKNIRSHLHKYLYKGL
jgi:tRNA-dihydrouridine synthase